MCFENQSYDQLYVNNLINRNYHFGKRIMNNIKLTDLVNDLTQVGHIVSTPYDMILIFDLDGKYINSVDTESVDINQQQTHLSLMSQLQVSESDPRSFFYCAQGNLMRTNCMKHFKLIPSFGFIVYGSNDRIVICHIERNDAIAKCILEQLMRYETLPEDEWNLVGESFGDKVEECGIDAINWQPTLFD